jgi:hypothetical protein
MTFTKFLVGITVLVALGIDVSEGRPDRRWIQSTGVGAYNAVQIRFISNLYN